MSEHTVYTAMDIDNVKKNIISVKKVDIKGTVAGDFLTPCRA